MRYADVKSLILSKCGLKEVILDNLVSDGRNSKRVTVGLAEEEDAALLVRHINGLYLEGRQLYVEDVRKKKVCDSTMWPIINTPHFMTDMLTFIIIAVLSNHVEKC